MKTTLPARLVLTGALALCTHTLYAATWYVAPTGSDSAPGTSELKPFKTIQKGINKAKAGDTVLVSPGVYSTGTQSSSPASGKSRIKITKDITVRSTKGAAVTYIVGQPHSSKLAFGSKSVRCVYMTAGTLDGFTLVNGFANAKYLTFKKDSPVINGGGVFAPVDNRTPQVNNCIIAGCGAYRGGGAYWATLNNCTVVSNYVNTTSGDGVWGSLVRNSIVFDNGNQNYSSGADSIDPTLFVSSCTTPAPGLNKYGESRDGGGNMTNNPLFQANSFVPTIGSPCRNAGNNAYAFGPRDAAGNSRILDGAVDIGAYESALYGLTVLNGSGSGSYLAGTVVPIVANTSLVWTVFSRWSGDTATVASIYNPTTTLIMPATNITVRALYDKPTYSVSVVNGRDAGAWPNAFCESTGEPDGSYPPGALVRIVASPAPLWLTFDRWSATPDVVFSNRFADVSMFVMPSNDVAITAEYRPQTAAERLGGALTVRGQALGISAFSTNGVVAEATGGIRYNDPVVKMGGTSVARNQSVSLTTTNFVGNGILLFWWHSDAEQGYDGVQVLVNGAATPLFCSRKDTNRFDNAQIWTLSYVRVAAASTITWRFTRDDTYYIHNNMVLLDRVTWIPQAMVNALGAGACIPNINAEYDPLFLGRSFTGEAEDFEGEDGGVAWVSNAPGGGSAIRLGAFGYVTNSLLAQVAVTNFGTGILTWDWSARSEAGYDFLEFQLNGVTTNWISGKEYGWYSTAFVVPNDPKTKREDNRGLKRILNFRYKKDADVSVFEDCGWLRNVGWTPTFALTLEKGTNTAFTLPAPFNLYADAYKEAENGIFPAGSQLTIVANAPDAGSFFDRWTGYGAGALGAQVTSATATFLMPAYDVSLTATYTTNSKSKLASAAWRQKAATAPQSRVTGFALAGPGAASAWTAQAASGLASAPATVALSFEGEVQTDYEVLFSPALSGPACAWQSLPVVCTEAQGDTADGKRLLRVYAEAPADAPQGFFRIQPR